HADVHTFTKIVIQSIVVGDFFVLNRANLSPELIGPPRLNRSRTRRRLIVIVAPIEVQGVRTEILQLEPSISPQLTLRPKIPLIHPGRRQIRIFSEDVKHGWSAVEARRRSGIVKGEQASGRDVRSERG